MQTQQSTEAKDPVTHPRDSSSRACFSGLHFVAGGEGCMCWERFCPKTLLLTLLILYCRGGDRPSLQRVPQQPPACALSKHTYSY